MLQWRWKKRAVISISENKNLSATIQTSETVRDIIIYSWEVQSFLVIIKKNKVALTFCIN